MASHTTQDWEERLGEQIRSERLRLGLDQVTLAARSNISVSSLSKLENGEGSRVHTLIKVIRALGREDWLEALAPAAQVSPLAMLRDRDLPAPRQRVTKAIRAQGSP